MSGMCSTWTGWLAFAAASLVLAVTPGPGVAYIVTRTLSQGRAAGLASVAGVALGNLGNALLASLGLAALIASTRWAFGLIKLAGAFYLVMLGINAGRAPPAVEAAARPQAQAPRTSLRDGFTVALLNPKTALFFVAFLPQFFDPRCSTLGQSLLFGALFVSVAAATDTLYVLAAHASAALLRDSPRKRRLVRGLTASVYLGLGVWAALGLVV